LKFMEKETEQPLLSPGQLLRDEKGHPFKDPAREADTSVNFGRSERVYSSPGFRSENQSVYSNTLNEGNEGQRSGEVHELRKYHEPAPPASPGYVDSFVSDDTIIKEGAKTLEQDSPTIDITPGDDGLRRRTSAGKWHQKLFPQAASQGHEENVHDVPVVLTKSCYSLAITGALTGAIAAIIAIVDGVKSQGFGLHIPFSLHHVNIGWSLTLTGVQTLTLAILLGLTVLGILPHYVRVLNHYAPLLCFLLAIFTAGISGLLGVASVFLNVAAALLGTAAIVADKIEIAAQSHRQLETNPQEFLSRGRGKEEQSHESAS